MSPTSPATGWEAPALDDVRMVTDEVWRSLLGEIEELTPHPAPAGAGFTSSSGGAWSAVVTVTGEWQGVVTVELGEDVAHDLTRRMLAVPENEGVTDADTADAVGELVNMIGGNVKSLMPGPSALSLPTVAAGRAAFSSEITEVLRLDVLWREAPVRVCVHAAGGGVR